MTRKTSPVFMGLFIAMAVMASALILTLPALFGSYEPHQFWLTVGLGGATAILAVALILLRPPRNTPTS
ncbi:hypothetical protein AC792_01050 [Arthrobacter sp. RIT-PI-e]|uniref:hypothetical protein n=1 Tax=Arthrobacter sp. RIT-PI-e TaxID=1681197 RepID=UPI0006762EF0|nr:hypothetical protein [Arthrobacter sp. RIT-PI-e]KNC20370.1 hypothetical protein AC792_01050 [Arthrobacter sp. RIT-PI-e]